MLTLWAAAAPSRSDDDSRRRGTPTPQRWSSDPVRVAVRSERRERGPRAMQGRGRGPHPSKPRSRTRLRLMGTEVRESALRAR